VRFGANVDGEKTGGPNEDVVDAMEVVAEPKAATVGEVAPNNAVASAGVLME
jgi:hypothetical protein